jgi:rifampicin phosphotransferase
MGKRIERHFGAPQDIEWAFDAQGELFVLQSRPVTGLRKQEPQTPTPTSAMSMIFSKFGASG